MVAEHSPSLGLLSPHGERSAAQGGATDRQVDCPDVLVPEEPSALPDRHPTDVCPWATGGSGAWDDARPDVAAAAAHPVLADADAGKSVDLEQDGLARGAMQSAPRAALASAEAPYKPAAGRFAARSFSAAVWRERQAWEAQPIPGQAEVLSGQLEAPQLAPSAPVAELATMQWAALDARVQRPREQPSQQAEPAALLSAALVESRVGRLDAQPDEPRIVA